MPARHFLVSGHVQGVFFRASTREKAIELGIKGWVRNTENGAVEIHAEGEGEILDALEQWLHEGPPAATVNTVESSKADTGNHQEFVITD